MAAPTDVRVEAESLTTTRIRWTYPGTSAISVYRSPDGVTYSEITDGSTRPAVGTTEYEDVGLTAATKYWYKLSDDLGSTFSSVVTVYTHACGVNSDGKGVEITLPREDEETVKANTFNDLATIVEQGLVKFVSPDGRTCVACITDGALVVDCINYEGCDVVEVVTDQDINSISMPNCGDKDVNIDFLVPPNTTRKIGGWGRGIGFTGDEGFRAPIVGGSSGRIVRENIRNGYNINGNSGRSKSGNGTTGGNQGGAANSYGSCTCTPASDGGMRIVSCTRAGGANKSNSLGCQNAAKGLIALVCGGRGPYTWSKTGSVVLSGTTGTNITVTPPTNSGSGVAGTAYKKYGGRCDSGGGAPVDCAGATWLQNRAASYDCNDTLTSACGTVSTTVAANSCVTAPINIGSNACASVSPCHDGATCTYGTCDNRSALMISGGCNPCGVQAGATVTVTDATGASVTIVLAS